MGKRWEEWRALGVKIVDDGWTSPLGVPTFTDSGTYAPAYLVGKHEDKDGVSHVFLCDGYGASAETLQAASLDPVLGLKTSLSIFSTKFDVPFDREWDVMRLDPDAADFPDRLTALLAGVDVHTPVAFVLASADVDLEAILD